jgi:tetrahydromethanopterin S-methyltransferase subunit G
LNYADGWDDCLDTIAAIISKAENLDEVKRKIEYLRDLVKEKKFERIKRDLGIIGELP